ncbi:DUF4303 domain-containing protein [Janthinobacterium psychrotolerans]|uniref:DUF4303 domain-containing protein n=1 Tax=Janthinobacterium psychrotolerans TaxID=1747903 RepID=A0A1A7BZI1_9BURK|nr:DUF4303 domain-containing protein [Janthinobacterium psychrotolerans]OBV38907.1 protein of unknown function (DUF4303) [Janthinobacterium psychrotolerans]
MTSNYSLFYRHDGAAPAHFREARVFDTTFWSAEGAAMTWGEENRTRHASADQAQAAYAAFCAAALAEGYTLERASVIDPAVFDAPLLHTLLLNATRQAVAALRAAHPDQHFNAYALYSDDSAMTISLLANSGEALAGAEDEDEMLWNPPEWQFDEGGAYFDSAYRLLLQAHRDLPFDVDFEVLRASAFEAGIAALELLDREGLFGTGAEREETVLLFEVSDSDAIDGAVERLNTPAMVARLNAWMASWAD